MNFTDAKEISIIDFLSTIGKEPISIKGNQYYYLAPYRDCKDSSKPNFTVNGDSNVWFDYALSEGGKIIDLVMKMYNTNPQEALEIIGGKEIKSFSSHQESTLRKELSTLTVKKVKALENKALTQYLRERGIKISTSINAGLKECYYEVKGKQYFALAFPNDGGGFELRNKLFKSCTGKKAISTYKGEDNSKVSIFEGFMDYLSALEYFKVEKSKCDVIVLNSVALYEKQCLPILNQYNVINTFLDRDEAGFHLLKKIKSIENKKVIDRSKIYAGFKDFNEFLVGKN